MKKIKTKWDADTGYAICTIHDKDNIFIGEAKCCPEDKDMQSEITGCTIAHLRAELKYYQNMRQDFISRIAALKQLYYSINKSKQYNPHSYEATMLRRQIKVNEEELEILRDYIANSRATINKYIKDKDEFHNTIRKYRAEKENNEAKIN